ncbi:hypothetical protein G4Y73_10870 [Wenzhouxiangella sp. XN201]|uniref:hypothetical protein n=1 Tax=Wenzhouxiangella sp. XN201 TaxID=2710755 RepID=UPI0013CA5FD7|nr:hypothetical protein [Wenzhouxiangella sp. XN201]NEZ04653.1 hypothetical protein [Wenzhouxiangella sp. XN201]
MRPAKFKFLPALLILGVVAAASAQTPSVLDFQISGSPYHDILDTGAGSLLNYDLANDRIDFAVGSTGVYDSPLFCFDFASPEGVTLTATDANGHVVMDSVGMGADLGYDLAGNAISMSPASSVQCFFKSSNGTFGPFGKAVNPSRNSTDDGVTDRFFKDDFATYPEIQIEFTNLKINGSIANEVGSFDNVSVSPGDLITYDLVISNTGEGAAETLAFQELFPASDSLDASPFDASLSAGDWICIGAMFETFEDNGACPASSGTGSIRFQGISLPAQSQLVFEINREVTAGSEGVLNLYAGLVNGAGSQVESDVAEVDLGIVGEAVAMAFWNQPGSTVAGNLVLTDQGDPIEVAIVDANNNLVNSHNSGQISMELFNSNGFVAELQSYIDVIDGKAVFTNLSTQGLGLSAGTDYELRAVSTESFSSVRSQPFEITL